MHNEAEYVFHFLGKGVFFSRIFFFFFWGGGGDPEQNLKKVYVFFSFFLWGVIANGYKYPRYEIYTFFKTRGVQVM